MKCVLYYITSYMSVHQTMKINLLTMFLCISVYFLVCNYFVYDVQNATYSSHGGPCPAQDVFPWLNTKMKGHVFVWSRRG